VILGNEPASEQAASSKRCGNQMMMTVTSALHQSGRRAYCQENHSGEQRTAMRLSLSRSCALGNDIDGFGVSTR